MKRKFILVIAVMGILGGGFSGCSKDDDDNNNSNPTTPGVTINSEYQATFLVDGVAVSVVNGVGGVQSLTSNHTLSATFPDSSESTMGFGLYKDVGGNTQSLFDIDKGTYKFIGWDSTAFTTFFAKQSWPYSPNAANGVAIAYFDANGTKWSTDFGTANQTGSTFVIEDTKLQDFFGFKYMKVKASFSCKVYDGNGASKVITNGVGVFDFLAD
jgi:hypothetical protein